MKRKRLMKERQDYRKGGRVALNQGGQHTFDREAMEWFPHHPADQSGQHGSGNNGGGNGTPGVAPDSPFPDTGNIPYGQVTDVQSDLARKQIADAAAGEQMPKKAWIPKPTDLDTVNMEFAESKIERIPPDMPEGYGNEPITQAQKNQALRSQPPKNMKFAYHANGVTIAVPQDAGTRAKASDVKAPYDESVEKQPEIQLAAKQSKPSLEKAGVQTVRGREANVTSAQATGTEVDVDEIRALTEKAVTQGMPPESALEFAKAKFTEGVLRGVSEAQKQTGVGGQMSNTPQAERSTREEITGSVSDGDTDQINGIPTLEAATRQSVQGTARTREAISMVEETANLPPDITAAIIDDPISVAEKIDTQDVDVIAATAALPEAALVSVQMEGLLGGIEEGEIPLWARPAVATIHDNLSDRGMDISTVARDSLVNAIIQTAFPMAQANAQAIQRNAELNLSNEQAANLEEARLEVQLRLTNVANQQTAASQSAQMANNISIQQGTFQQQAGVRSAELQQQTYTQNLANQQEAARITAQQAQQAQMVNLSNEQQIAVLDLQLEADEMKDEFSAEQQVKLARFQTAADFMAKNVAFSNDMEKANLSKEVQVELANLTSRNMYQTELMTDAQRIELANLEAKMRVGLTNANLANAMGIAQLSADQAVAIQNAQVNAGMDMANFSTRQQMELANSKFMQSMTLTDFTQDFQAMMQNATSLAQLDLGTLDQRTKIAATNAQSFLQMDMASLNNQQQEFVMEAQQRQQTLLSDQAAFNASEQFNAASENQLNQYMAGLGQQIEITNKQRNDAMKTFNATQFNAAEARKAGYTMQANAMEAQLQTDVSKFNDQQDYNRSQFNVTNANAIEQYNINWRRDANKIDTAATNAVNQLNAQNAFGLSAQSMAFMWQELRDQMDYSFKTYDNDQARKASLITAAIGNEAAIGEDGGWAKTYSGMGTLITNFLSG